MSGILVIGETCRDVFVYCDSNRLCPEAPVPVLNIVDQRENPGMAGNVRRNIESLLGDAIDINTNTNWYEIAKTLIAHAEQQRVQLNTQVEDIQSITIAEYPTAAKRPLISQLDTRKLQSQLSFDLPHWKDDFLAVASEIIGELVAA